jgi:hypothetical protein
MFSEGIMPAWTSESTVGKSSWIVAAGSVTGEGITTTVVITVIVQY